MSLVDDFTAKAEAAGFRVHRGEMPELGEDVGVSTALFGLADTGSVVLAAAPDEPRAASLTLRAISLVVAFCSSTAVAMVLEMSFTCLMTSPIWPMAPTALLVSLWMASILRLMSSVAFAVCLASSLTSLATTANPLPASPARAASIVAFKASRLVCWAIEVITLMTCPISVDESPSLATI